MKRKRCFFSCVDWRNVALYLLLAVVLVVTLCLLPRWLLCFLILGLVCALAALVCLKK